MPGLPAPSDLLGAEALSPLNGSPLTVLDYAAPQPPGGVVVRVDRAGRLPELDPHSCDAALTTAPHAPAPWTPVSPARLDAQLRTVQAQACQAPIATAMLARVLRLGEGLPFDAALELESLAYSALLGGAEFARWRDATPVRASGSQAAPPVRYDRHGDVVTLTLASPGNRNAMTAAMRDGLYEALVNVLEDPGQPRVLLRGEGKCFSTGGALDEFGSAQDLAQAHVIRMQRSAARVLHRLGDRAEAELHGACIGSGIEVPLAAARRVGHADLVVQLPELRMGLIPGAGGTVTGARAVGRHRLLWLVLGGFRIGAAQALDLGLIHALRP